MKGVWVVSVWFVQRCLFLLILGMWRRLVDQRLYIFGASSWQVLLGIVILANSELTAINRPEVTKLQPLTAINGHSGVSTGINATLWHKIITYGKVFYNTYFGQFTNLTRNSSKKSFFPKDFDGTKPPENYKK